MFPFRTALLAFSLSSTLFAQAHWTRLYPAQSPTGRAEHAMAFDALRGRAVLFGGNRAGILGDTWEFDGSTWLQRVVAGPSARVNHAMAYDESRGVVVLFGGYGNSAMQDTWVPNRELFRGARRFSKRLA